MSQTAQLTINIEHVDLLSVSGKLDGAGLRLLQKHVDLLLEGGSRFLVTDLAQVASCDARLFDLLARTSDLVEGRGGWVRLVGLSSPVLDKLEDAALPEVLLVYQASHWANRGGPSSIDALRSALTAPAMATTSRPRPDHACPQIPATRVSR